VSVFPECRAIWAARLRVAGVTSVRDLANETDTSLAMKRRIDAGEELGPRIAMSGIPDGPGLSPLRPRY